MCVCVRESVYVCMRVYIYIYIYIFIYLYLLSLKHFFHIELLLAIYFYELCPLFIGNTFMLNLQWLKPGIRCLPIETETLG